MRDEAGDLAVEFGHDEDKIGVADSGPSRIGEVSFCGELVGVIDVMPPVGERTTACGYRSDLTLSTEESSIILSKTCSSPVEKRDNL